jgi:hypothetical protein
MYAACAHNHSSASTPPPQSHRKGQGSPPQLAGPQPLPALRHCATAATHCAAVLATATKPVSGSGSTGAGGAASGGAGAGGRRRRRLSHGRQRSSAGGLKGAARARSHAWCACVRTRNTDVCVARPCVGVCVYARVRASPARAPRREACQSPQRGPAGRPWGTTRTRTRTCAYTQATLHRVIHMRCCTHAAPSQPLALADRGRARDYRHGPSSHTHTHTHTLAHTLACTFTYTHTCHTHTRARSHPGKASCAAASREGASRAARGWCRYTCPAARVWRVKPSHTHTRPRACTNTRREQWRAAHKQTRVGWGWVA